MIANINDPVQWRLRNRGRKGNEASTMVFVYFVRIWRWRTGRPATSVWESTSTLLCVVRG